MLTVQNSGENQRKRNKIATLAPYLAEIEKRKKIKQSNRRSKQNVHQNSSKSFRIKQKSTSSLHKLTIETNKDIRFGDKLNVHEKRDKKIKSVQRSYQSSLSRTIEDNNRKKNNTRFFNELNVRTRSKVDKQKNFRKNMYEKINKDEVKSHQHEINPYKIGNQEIPFVGYTNITLVEPKERLPVDKKTENVRRNNFRRNKYEAISSLGAGDKKSIQYNSSVVLDQLDKKQSNVSINKEMDLVAEKQMQKFYRQVRNKELQKSLQKSTEKYFKNQSYRPTKSRNDIQVYISTIKNPSVHKVSHSTYDTCDNKKSLMVSSMKDNLLEYDFDFKHDHVFIKEDTNIQEIDNPSEQESSVPAFTEQDQFEKQRKKAEVQYFHKESPVLNWSDQHCAIDYI